jgi:hypothetical protein
MTSKLASKLGIDQVYVERLEIVLSVAAACLAFVALAIFVDRMPWDFADWTRVYYPAASDPLTAYDSRDTLRYVNPPWLAWLLSPLTLLRPRLAFSVWFALTIVLSIWSIYKLGGGFYITLLTLTSPAFIRLFVHGQVDVVVLVGFALMLSYQNVNLKSVGVILMLVKPQVLGLGAVVHWLGLGRSEQAGIALRVLVFVGFSFILHGLWPAAMWENIKWIQTTTNISPWPYGIPFGLAMLAISIRRGNAKLGALSTLFLAPYLNTSSLYAYSAVLFTMISARWATLAFLLLWILAIWAT